MNRTEFMDILQKTLAGSLGSNRVNENIRYYQEYFDMQMRMGRDETEIISELGNPRLLAKTIIEAARREGTSDYIDAQYREVYEDGTSAQGGSGFEERKNIHFHMPGWLIAVLTVLVLVLIVKVIGSVIIAFLPVIVPAVCALLLLRFLQNR